MSAFVKLVTVFSAVLMATVSAADKTTDDKSKKPETKDSGEKKSKKDKKKEKPPEDPNAPPKPIQVPMPNGHDAKVLNIPYRNPDGKLMMRFIIGVATKVDDNHVDMDDLQIETFDDDGEHEMSMDLPKSQLDLTTSVITAHQAVTIKREDFELTGNTMIFNTRTKIGGLGGDVKMTIYNLESETSQALAPKTPAAPAAGDEKPASGTPPTPEPKAK